jgi:hypothetical protein
MAVKRPPFVMTYLPALAGMEAFEGVRTGANALINQPRGH